MLESVNEDMILAKEFQLLDEKTNEKVNLHPVAMEQGVVQISSKVKRKRENR